MKAPSEKIRTTLNRIGADLLPYCGIYVLAYMGKIVYVGKTEYSVDGHLRTHMYQPSSLGRWMWGVRDDWANVRLDILVPPIREEIKYWLGETEAKLVNRFRPLFNERLFSEEN